MNKRMMTVLAGAFVLAAAVQAEAQTADATATITIPTVLYIDVTGGLNPTFSGITQAELDAGEVAAADQTTITHAGNITHSVTVTADEATLNYDNEGNGESDPSKPVSDISFLSSTAEAGALSTSAATLRSGAARGLHTDLTVDWSAAVSFDDPPGIYDVPITYTVVAN